MGMREKITGPVGLLSGPSGQMLAEVRDRNQ